MGLEGRGEATRGEAGVAMTERPHRGVVNLRLDPGNAEVMAAIEAGFGFAPGNAEVMAAIEAGFGFALPTTANDTAGIADTIALWLGPDEWWLVVLGPEPEAGPELAEKLRAALGGRPRRHRHRGRREPHLHPGLGSTRARAPTKRLPARSAFARFPGRRLRPVDPGQGGRDPAPLRRRKRGPGRRRGPGLRHLRAAQLC
jgi:hypothetical protein